MAETHSRGSGNFSGSYASHGNQFPNRRDRSLRTRLGLAGVVLLLGLAGVGCGDDDHHASAGAQKIDLGEVWTVMTGLPFVYAVWAGWPRAVTPGDAKRLQDARDRGVANSDEIARAFCPDDPMREAVAKRYLRDNIQYSLGEEELQGLQMFYRYATELGLASYDGRLRFYHAEHTGVR